MNTGSIGIQNPVADTQLLWEQFLDWCQPENLDDDKSRRDRFMQDWIGASADSHAEPNRAASCLWELTRGLIRERASDRQRELLTVLSQALDKHRGSFIHFVMAEYEKRIRRIQASQLQLEHFLASLVGNANLARAALLLASGELGQSDKQRRVVKSIQEFIKSQTKSAIPDEIQLADRTGTPDSLGLVSEILSAIATQQPDNNVLLRAILQCEHSISWLLNLTDPTQVKSLVVPLYTESTGNGSLALLEIVQFPSLVLKQYKIAPLVAPNVVSQGLMTFDEDWQNAFQTALEWTSTIASDRHCSHFLYRLRFAFSSLTEHPHSERHVFSRPMKVCGGSASLAAGLLMRALLEQRSVARNFCVTGSIEKSSCGFGLAVIGHCLPKLNAYEKAVKEILGIGSMLIGATTKHDEESTRTLEFLGRVTRIQRPETVQQAYDLVTSVPSLIATYAYSERVRIRNRISLFSPTRLRESIALDSPTGIEPTLFDALDQITLRQRAIRFDYKRDSKKTNSGERKDSAPLLDDLMRGFVSQTDRANTLKIVGGPGMGKTWVGLRWHLRLLRNLWTTFTSSTSDSNFPWLPVWVTARELGEQLKSHGNVAGSIKAILRSRMAPHESAPNETDEFLKLFEQYLDARQVFLTVDAWDERLQDFDIDQQLQHALSVWSKDRKLLITCRSASQSDTTTDPFPFCFGSQKTWFIVPETEGESSHDFIHRWFGEARSDYSEQLLRLQTDPHFNELFKVPQLVAILCWRIENDALPQQCTRAAKLLEDTLQQILKKSPERYSHPPSTHFLDGIQSGRVLKFLQLLAYHTFKGERWEFTAADLSSELDKEIYASHVRNLAGGSSDRLANLTLETGLFTPGSSNQFEIVHQTLAEVLVAGQLVSLNIQFPSVESLDDSIDFAARRGMLDSRWDNVWRNYAGLAASGTAFLIFLLRLRELAPEIYFETNLKTRMTELIDAVYAECAVETGCGEIEQLIDTKLEEFISSRRQQWELWDSAWVNWHSELKFNAVAEYVRVGYRRPVDRRIAILESVMHRTTEVSSSLSTTEVYKELAVLHLLLYQSGHASQDELLTRFRQFPKVADINNLPVQLDFRQTCELMMRWLKEKADIDARFLEHVIRGITNAHQQLAPIYLPLAIRFAQQDRKNIPKFMDYLAILSNSDHDCLIGHQEAIDQLVRNLLDEAEELLESIDDYDRENVSVGYAVVYVRPILNIYIFQNSFGHDTTQTITALKEILDESVVEIESATKKWTHEPPSWQLKLEIKELLTHVLIHVDALSIPINPIQALLDRVTAAREEVQYRAVCLNDWDEGTIPSTRLQNEQQRLNSNCVGTTQRETQLSQILCYLCINTIFEDFVFDWNLAWHPACDIEMLALHFFGRSDAHPDEVVGFIGTVRIDNLSAYQCELPTNYHSLKEQDFKSLLSNEVRQANAEIAVFKAIVWLEKRCPRKWIWPVNRIEGRIPKTSDDRRANLPTTTFIFQRAGMIPLTENTIATASNLPLGLLFKNPTLIRVHFNDLEEDEALSKYIDMANSMKTPRWYDNYQGWKTRAEAFSESRRKRQSISNQLLNQQNSVNSTAALNQDEVPHE